MTDDINKRMATLLALLDLKEAVARDDVQAAREIREKRLIRMLDSFSADEGEALKQAWNTSGRWTRYVESANPWKHSNARSRILEIWKHR